MGINITATRLKTHLCFLLFLSVASPSVFCQEKPVVGILPFESIKVSRADAGIVYAFMETNFIDTAVYEVVTAEQRDQILATAGDTIPECKDNDCAVEIGRKLSADHIVLGSVALSEGRYIVNAKVIAVAASRTIAADSISAAELDDLETACRDLTIGLVRRAVPGSWVQEQDPGATSAEEGAGQGTEASKSGMETQLPDEGAGSGVDLSPGPTEKLSKADLWPLVNICGGIFFLELGNVMGSTGFELRRRISDAHVDYSEASWNFDELWKTYNSAYSGYVFTTTLSYVSWSLAVASVPTYLAVFPDKAFRFSRWGKRLFTAGAALSIAGNVLDLMAGAQRYTNDSLYEDYLAAGDPIDMDELYTRYRNGHILYSIERLTSYAFWLVGGAGMITAFFIPGPKEEPISGFWDKASLIGGLSLVGLGSVTRTVALNYRQTFIESDGNDESAYDRYVLNSILSYGFWAVGGVGMLLPFFTDIGGGKARAEPQQVRPEKLRLLPLANGIVIDISL
jgi:TolB-like protein